MSKPKLPKILYPVFWAGMLYGKIKEKIKKARGKK
jgi:hypothetical protein